MPHALLCRTCNIVSATGPHEVWNDVLPLTQIEELVDGLRDAMPGIMTGNASQYEAAASTIAMRESVALF
jgi:hypothetical protein